MGGATSCAEASWGATPKYASCTTGEAITVAGSPSATRAPLCNTMMRSASSRTTSILCSTNRMVLVLSFLSARIRFRMTGASSWLMPAVGSSNMYTAGSSAMSKATSSLRWSPCGRLATVCACLSRMDTASRMVCARSVSARWSLQMLHKFKPRKCAPTCVACTARRTFSSTDKFGNKLVS